MMRDGGRTSFWTALGVALLVGGGTSPAQAGVMAMTFGLQVLAPPSSQAAGQGMVLDRIVAVVDEDVVLESDVDEEQRFASFQVSVDSEEKVSRTLAVERLINRDLILQQLKIQPQAPVTDKEVDDRLLLLRKDLPACRAEHCETDAGWKAFLSEHGFTEEELKDRWKQRMEVLRFIEQRFRMGIRISPDEIKTYYEKTLLPQYEMRKVKAPKLEVVSERIQEVLLQQQVSSLLGDWLKSLRAQGTVRIVGQDEASAQ